VNPDPLTVIPDDPEPGHDWEPNRSDFALIVGAASVIAIILLLVGGTRV
jgi:hypothetical protein